MTEMIITYDREADGRWIAEVEALPGCMVYGASRDEARRRVVVLALQMVAERVEHGEWPTEFTGVRIADAA